MCERLGLGYNPLMYNIAMNSQCLGYAWVISVRMP